MANCPECCEDIDVGFDDLMEILICPQCGIQLEVWYDESHNEETGEEDGWFWVERYRGQKGE